jgi:alkylation response protein AidB-like acyl-CoA dehydrogenase
MDFDFTEEQTLLRQSLAGYLEKNYSFEQRQAIVRSDRPFSADVWAALGEFGLLGLPLPEDVGGSGGSAADLVAVGEVLGEHLVVEPYLSSVVLAGRALAAVGDSSAARTWLQRIATGDALAAFAHEEGRGTPDPAQVALHCSREGDGFRLDGEKHVVLGGAEADVLVVTARLEGAGGPALLVVESGAPGLRRTPFPTVDGRSAAHVVFDGVVVPAENCLAPDASAALADVLSGAVLALAAEGVGAMGALLRLTGAYAATRTQFGVAIVTFQAVAHRLADMKMACLQARATLLHTAALAEAGRATPRDLSVLKAQVGRLGRLVGEAAVQIHGGVGMTDELSIGHYLKRLLVLDALFGDSEHHYRLVGAAPR